MMTVTVNRMGPSEQGHSDGMKGWHYDNPYTDEDEKMQHEAYRRSYHIGLLHHMKREEFMLLNNHA